MVAQDLAVEPGLIIAGLLIALGSPKLDRQHDRRKSLSSITRGRSLGLPEASTTSNPLSNRGPAAAATCRPLGSKIVHADRSRVIHPSCVHPLPWCASARPRW